MKVLIIGGVAGGATAAARLRRLDETAEIIILERSGFISYANCGLPYYVGGTITNPDELTLQTPESFWRRFRIQVRTKNEVTAIHPETKSVTVRKLEDGEVYEESYDKLILSPGAKPLQPPVSGVDHERIFTLRTVEDTFRLHDYLHKHDPHTAVIAGGGYIGLEMAENLAEMGMDVSIVQRPDHVMAPFDYDMACQLHRYLHKKGIQLYLSSTVEGFSESDGQMLTLRKEKKPLRSDIVLLALGVTPETELAKQAGLELGVKGTIVVNARMETSVPDIYAVGDAVEVTNFVSGKRVSIPLAGPANKQGRIVADVISGKSSQYKGSQGSSIIKIFDMTAAVTGINETAAKAAGLNYDKVVTHSPSHATYYPGSREMTVKTLFDLDSGKILGAQIIGYEGVDKRIDVMATAIRAGMTAADLAELDLAYAPPYSSAKDPVNMAGFVIENIMDGVMKQFHWHDVPDLAVDDEVTLLDTRTEMEYFHGHIHGAINIPLDDLRDRIGELDTAKPVYVICRSGLRSYIACRILAQNGFDCFNLSGGYRFYEMVTKGEKSHDRGVYA